MTQFQDAYRMYLLRQQHVSIPAGRWEGAPKTSSWISHEFMPCCEGVKELNTHSKTATHVAHLVGLPDIDAFRNYVAHRRRRDLRHVRGYQSAKIDERDVIEIRRRAAKGESYASITRDFPISTDVIRCVVNRELYAWAEEALK